MNKYRWLIILSVAINIIFIAGSAWLIQHKGGSRWFLTTILTSLSKPQQHISYAELRQDTLSVLDITQDDIVFIGDSILDSGEWHELLGAKNIKNRAVSGSDTAYLLKHIASLTGVSPKYFIMETGVNNILHREPYKKIMREYKAIVEHILSTTTHTELWILPVLPIHHAMYQQWFLPEHHIATIPSIEDFQRINQAIKEISLNNQRVHLIDLNSLLNANGELNEKYTLDGVHLNGLGLREVARTLKKHAPLLPY